MLAALGLGGRLLLRHWPALLAWFLAGVLARYIIIELAGFVGAFTAIGGQLILALAVLARLVSFVAMFLVVRDGMVQLGALAPQPEGRLARRRAFLDAVLGGILPFFAFYAAWGYLRDDVAAYLARALEVQTGLSLQAAVSGEDFVTDGTIDDLQLGPITITLIVVAFAGRWAFKRYAARLPRFTSVVAVYLETVWVFLSVTLVAAGVGQVTAWVQSRQAMVWLADLREWIADRLSVVGWIWDGVEWVLGEAGGIILLPVAWLVIAGVIYGQAVAPQAPVLSSRLFTTVGKRYARIPGVLQRRVRDVWVDLTGRFRPIGRAILLMWRAGPLIIGTYVLAYTLVLALEGWLQVGVIRLAGPQDLRTFWMVFDELVLLAVPLVVEPIRVALIAGAYDATVGALRVRAAAAAVESEAAVPPARIEDPVDRAGAQADGEGGEATPEGGGAGQRTRRSGVDDQPGVGG